MESQNLSLSLFGRKNSDKKSVTVYVVIRTSGVGEKRVSTGINLPLGNFRNGKLIGRTSMVAEAEKRIGIVKKKLEDAYWKIIESDRIPDPDLIYTEMINKREGGRTILEVIDVIIAWKKTLRKNDEVGPDLVDKFVTIKENISSFIKSVYGRNNVFLDEVNLDFITKFSGYLKSIPNSNITVNKKISNLSHALKYAVSNGWMKANPCSLWKPLTKPKTNDEMLTLEQFREFCNFRLPNNTHEVVKDTFIFMCLTGMSFSDMKRFSYSDIRFSGEIHIIEYIRNKTKKYNRSIRIPVLPMAMKLIEKHYQKPVRAKKRGWKNKGPEDPVFSVQGLKIYNEKIKYLFDYNEMVLDFDVSSHAGRKTFGNLVNRLMGMSVASMFLGHSSVRTTENNYVDNGEVTLHMERSQMLYSMLDNELEL